MIAILSSSEKEEGDGKESITSPDESDSDVVFKEDSEEHEKKKSLESFDDLAEGVKREVKKITLRKVGRQENFEGIGSNMTGGGEEMKFVKNEEDVSKKRGNEYKLEQCLYHRVQCTHQLCLMKMRNESVVVELDDILRLYSGDYLLLENVIEYFDILELLLRVYNAKSKSFYLITVRVNRHRYWQVVKMKNHFVKIDYDTKEISLVEPRCNCYFH